MNHKNQRSGWRSVLVGALLTALPTFSAAAPDPGKAPLPTTNPSPEAAVRALLSGYEFVPTEAHFRAVGDNLGPVLVKAAQDPALGLLTRARAISAMVHVPPQKTHDVLINLAADSGTPSVLRRKAMFVLADLHGDLHLDLVVSVFVSAPEDTLLREACARAFRSMGPAAYPTRSELFRQEKAPTVRALLRTDKAIK